MIFDGIVLWKKKKKKHRWERMRKRQQQIATTMEQCNCVWFDEAIEVSQLEMVGWTKPKKIFLPIVIAAQKKEEGEETYGPTR